MFHIIKTSILYKIHEINNEKQLLDTLRLTATFFLNFVLKRGGNNKGSDEEELFQTYLILGNVTWGSVLGQ